jgi:hypothetical protein
MTGGMGADADARRAAHLVEGVKIGRLAGKKDVGVARFCRADVDELVDIVVAPRKAQDRPGNHGAGGGDLETVGFGRVKVVRRLPS